jgi:hypothetical protein
MTRIHSLLLVAVLAIGAAGCDDDSGSTLEPYGFDSADDAGRRRSRTLSPDAGTDRFDAGMDAAMRDTGTAAEAGSEAPAQDAAKRSMPWPDANIPTCDEDAGTGSDGAGYVWTDETFDCTASSWELAPIEFKSYGAEDFGEWPEPGGMLVGKHHFLVNFVREATQCQILEAVSSVNGYLTGYMEIGLAIVEIPCVDFPGLEEAMNSMEQNPIVSSVSFDFILFPM